ncbi:OB-fold nucleic acid binding domain-containing protein [Actinomadura syzygii]|uniref:OB-fold nucleic acid binding domain-containing protein n=2 Tax=Actinomadura TaxID=1988 RepID=A0A5D0U3A3_9ACTN|nr:MULTISPECIES: OB-fold nucleic acid binding domain-containing protein [Actinomadura]TYC12557.1 OB-fold nucleic acid binding domain-containing protein [Actinomadura syzygii]TYK46132.1 OB-fold nucleic acid binding domain-containing protein [Actinomadura decatromicini]
MDEVSAGTPQGAGPGRRGRGGRPPAKGGGLRRFLRRMASSTAELEAEELQRTSGDEGATPITECGERTRHCVAGTLRTVTLRPRGGAPALEAELYDGTDVISLVWLGRRKIAGIDPGRMLRAEGLVSVQDGRKVMFNPRYELRGGS